MIRRLFNRLVLPLMLSGMIMIPVTSGTASAWNPFGSACNQSSGHNSAVCSDNGSTGGANNQNPFVHVIVQITRVVIIVAGIASIIIIIISGIRFMTSGGDPNQTAQARKTLMNALVGLLIVILAQAIVSLVIGGL